MADNTWWEKVEAKGGEVVDKVKEIVEEGNVRRVRIRQKDRVIAEFPLTFGVVGAVLAPIFAAIATIAALLTECSIEVEREKPAGGDAPKDVTH
jgi:hypothetical protein